MVEGKETEKISTEKFFTTGGNAKAERNTYYFKRADRVVEQPAPKTEKIRHGPFEKTADTFRTNKLIRNTAICAAAALVIWGIASSNTPAGKQASEAIENVMSYEMDIEDDIGDLQFVDSKLEEDASLVSADENAAAGGEVEQVAEAEAAAGEAEAGAGDAQFVYPLDGIVTATFAENGAGAIITATDSKDVKSSRTGSVSEVSENYVSILNDDSTVSTYYGITSSVQTGDSVQAGQVIGQLLSDALYVEQDAQGTKTDPLA